MEKVQQSGIIVRLMDPHLRISILALWLPLCAVADDRYLAVFDDDLAAVTVEACFDGAAPARLYRNSQAGDFAVWVRHAGKDFAAGARRDSLRLSGLADGSCVSWRVDLARAVARGDYRLALRMGNDILTRGDLWFWRDGEKRAILVDVRLPAGNSISTPWKAVEPGTRFRPDPTPAHWSSRIAVGGFRVRRVPTGGTELRVAVVGNPGRSKREELVKWMQDTADAVASVYGRFPQDSPQILIVPIGARHSTVPWAHVIRGGGVAAEFFVDETRPLSTLRNDWTAPHELSHMLLPYVSSRDRWLSEGLASYYQNVLRARDGLLSEQQAWQKLYEGFERGRAATSGGSLASATRSGWNATMRVYWSGAAIMLKADAELRRNSRGARSLDTVLASLRECCLENGRSWSARELFQRLDHISGAPVFSKLYRQHVPDSEFPDVDSTFRQLGLVVERDRVILDPDAPWGRIRYYIMNG